MTNPARRDGPAVDPRHLLVIGAGPGLGGGIAHRFARGGYRLTLLARRTDGLAKLASDLADTGAAVDTVAADAGDPAGLRAALTSLYARPGAPGVLVYDAGFDADPDSLLSSDVAGLHQAYDVDVVGAIVAAQVAAPAMRAAGGGTILFTGGGWADHPARPGPPSHSARPRCRRRPTCSAPTWRTTAYASPASPSPGRSGRAHRSARTRSQRNTGRSCNQTAPGKTNSASTEHEPRGLAHHLARTACPVLARWLAAPLLACPVRRGCR